MAGEEEVINGNERIGYTPLYPLSTTIVLSFLFDSTEVYLFREYICQKLQKPAFVITLIFLIGNADN